ncbi:TetR/AcrR family transcriptional regulator [Endozoicomonas ascidiicola]|uniref:TetR/AcrR family transcriptional regulator n=1 Tax=Endozoicomonas ascidiicola TaxID=1698521 RepID=UPI00082ADA71|nr:TetR/AcrR family transcriptional regulator [Endozoicomonas ascidiicola]
MAASDKRAQRESDIIQSTLELLKQKGFMELKMSEVAKHAQYSMGTVYSHFSSKEDLLLGCATSVAGQAEATFQKILTSAIAPTERLLTLIIANWLSDARDPHYFFLRQLAMNPDIWTRASEKRAQALDDICHCVAQKVEALIVELLPDNPSLMTSKHDGTITDILMGLWSMSEGLYRISLSGFGLKQPSFHKDRGLNLLAINLEKYLRGWGWTLEFSPALIASCKAQAETMISELFH